MDKMSRESEREHGPSVDAPQGHYANYFEVGHNAFEFVIDFGQFYPQTHQDNVRTRIHTRIIATPVYAKALLKTLGESLEHYEQSFSVIPNEDETPTK